ncbi:tetratricopeptide repeat protein [Burkholderiaceae bacterium DAT-1]|nr:tetratricopeptide repeat protein [Burkholderiaceae bacterium DAT-1]
MADLKNILESGLAMQNAGQHDTARSLFNQALALDPDNIIALYSLSIILLNVDSQPDVALQKISHAVKVSPAFSQGHFARGVIHQSLGKYDAALADFDEAIRLNPQYAEALINRGALLRELHRHHDAISSFKQALDIDPSNITALGNYGIMLSEYKQHKAAAEVFSALIKQAPDYDYGPGLLVYEQLHMCDWSQYHALKAAIESGLREDKRTCKSLALMSVSDEAELHFKAAHLFADKRFAPEHDPAIAAGHYRHKRIRIGYVSPDFREHPVGQLIVGVLESHDRERFEVYGYSIGMDDGSDRRDRIKAACDHFYDLKATPAKEAAALIRSHEIDILIDLAGYTSDSRTKIFAWRPAPVQINFLGYPGTMGVNYYDYILADPQVIPQEHEAYYSEKVLRMPHCYLPTDASLMAERPTPLRATYGLPETGVIFCSFNHEHKINPDVFGSWMRIMQQVPGSVLWLMGRNEMVIRNLQEEAGRHGISAERLIFASRVPSLSDHLARYQLADMFLDTFPYNAHTTASDALLSGLPVITLAGHSFPSRVASSLLKAVGMESLITHSREEYEQLAIRLANAPAELAAIKQRLNDNKRSYPLFDTAGFCHDLEALLARTLGQHQKAHASQQVRHEKASKALSAKAISASTESKRLVSVVPVYRAELPLKERHALDLSLKHLNGHALCFVHPRSLNLDWYRQCYPSATFEAFDDSYFVSVNAYSRLLLDPAFYSAFTTWPMMLLLQTDAAILKPGIESWLEMPYDYIGAPWPDGFEFFVNADQFAGSNGIKIRVTVGNGGLSLRRPEACICALQEFPGLASTFARSGSNEDLYFAIAGQISRHFRVPNEMVAARFSLERAVEKYFKRTGELPLATHAFEKYEPDFWREHCPGLWPSH